MTSVSSKPSDKGVLTFQPKLVCMFKNNLFKWEMGLLIFYIILNLKDLFMGGIEWETLYKTEGGR